jgi:hypothetical protein
MERIGGIANRRNEIVVQIFAAAGVNSSGPCRYLAPPTLDLAFDEWD